ncbi:MULTISPECIES: hypothetical protein [unclassified Enterococcus]|uniref:hypothetical protein n=1 Tax=unclassified Enterococcus TaxID=2608891 RepID=UPI001552F2C4|nr:MULTISPECIES: hypothetical protein [unclassified Enterococcus]MBS7576787.1 hypothetical protein [Enterococcus sp. MMGLQ5-2]MBS7584194.1 hypothetical protein [Enterococcus sp. MMGLQ5-1]NPD12052.1 hypothetical protein [Enterococcus sp. MMGLQ5-1]NPD36624.1 hypothetical protein [Enterococcus sp. MMGLQ5-2]
MKKLLLSMILFAGILGLSATSSATEVDNGDGTKTVDGTGSTSIPVTGTLGADNTKEDGGIPEGSTQWVNVVVPSKTIFYSLPGATTIQSPTYTVKNQSGRPVTVDIASFNAVDETAISGTNLSVSLNATGATESSVTASTSVISSAAAVGTLNTKLADLANVNNRFTSAGAAVSGANQLSFSYGGTLTAVNTQKIGTYNLMLSFSVPTNW